MATSTWRGSKPRSVCAPTAAGCARTNRSGPAAPCDSATCADDQDGAQRDASRAIGHGSRRGCSPACWSPRVACSAGARPKAIAVSTAEQQRSPPAPCRRSRTSKRIGHGQRAGRTLRRAGRAATAPRRSPAALASAASSSGLGEELPDQTASGWRRATGGPPSPAGGRRRAPASRPATLAQATRSTRPTVRPSITRNPVTGPARVGRQPERLLVHHRDATGLARARSSTRRDVRGAAAPATPCELRLRLLRWLAPARQTSDQRVCRGRRGRRLSPV